jgi:hypothetical protein
MLQNTNVKQCWTGDGSTTVFPYNLQLPADDLNGSTLQLYTLDTLRIQKGPLTQNSDYSVDVTNFQITYPLSGKPLASGCQLIALRVIPLTQTAQFSNQGNFNPGLLTPIFDRMTMMIQGFNEQLSRAWIASITSTNNYDLPSAQASYLLGWNSDGTNLINYKNPDSEIAMNEIQGADIVAAATTDIGSSTGTFLRVIGSATITALGSATAGNRRIVLFTGSCVLTYNSTSLILPGAANITTSAGDVLTFISLGSGNWKCIDYLPNIAYSNYSKYWQLSTVYIAGQTRYLPSYPYIQLECVVAGISGTSEPSSFTVNSLLTDGSVTWMVYDTRNVSPAMSFNNVTITNTSTTITLASGALIGLRNSAGTRVINILTSSDIALTPTLAASAAYYLWLVYTASTNTTALILTTTATAPSYDYYRYLGGRFTNSSSLLYIVKQIENKCQYVVDGTVLTGMRQLGSGTASQWTAISISNFVPSTAKSIYGSVIINGTVSETAYLFVAPNNNYGSTTSTYPPCVTIANSSIGAANASFNFLLESTNIYWYSNIAAAYIYCLGWKENL